jgi:hypothetical protein
MVRESPARKQWPNLQVKSTVIRSKNLSDLTSLRSKSLHCYALTLLPDVAGTDVRGDRWSTLEFPAGHG